MSTTIVTSQQSFARITDVAVGSILIADDGFACLEAGSENEVLSPNGRDLCVVCRDGIHWLDGQTGDTAETAGRYVGLYLKGGE